MFENTFIISLIGFLVVLTPLVFIHELGHYLAAIKNVVIVDDMVDTDGTLTKAADLMVDRGAKSVRAVCTHALLSGNAYDNI